MQPALSVSAAHSQLVPLRAVDAVTFTLRESVDYALEGQGGAFPKLEAMQDQHEAAYALPENVAHVAVAYTMSVGKSANQALAKQGADFLPAQNAVFIANIYGMPAVGRFFAMPKMKKYPHRIMLADAEGLLDAFPQKEDRVTVFDLDPSGKIVAIRYWDPESGKYPF